MRSCTTALEPRSNYLADQLLTFLIALAIVALAMFVPWAISHQVSGEMRAISTLRPVTLTFPATLWILAPIALIGCLSILQTRKWVVATVVMLFLSLLLSPPLAYSGPASPGVVWGIYQIKLALGPIMVFICVALSHAIAPKLSWWHQ